MNAHSDVFCENLLKLPQMRRLLMLESESLDLLLLQLSKDLDEIQPILVGDV
jgi:hypothetical protein